MIRNVLVFAGILTTATTQAPAQSSSLYVQPVEQQAQPVRYFVEPVEQPDPMIPAIREHSRLAVKPPPPREFQVNDLVTVVIRESMETDFEAELSTEKESKISGEISNMIDLKQLLTEFVLANQTYEGGNPKVDLTLGKEFEGEGEYARKETVTGRITARIVDIKPNGTMVLEARKSIQSDKESLDMVLTGTCRAEDITADNTVLSSELFDLRLDKQHKGELKKTTKKGLITKLFDLLFNF